MAPYPLKPLRPILVLTALACAACTPQAEQNKDLRTHVAEFYRVHQSAAPIGPLSLPELMTFRPLLSVALFEKFKDASVAEEAHFAGNADSLAPLFDGDLFTARPQGFAAAQILDCTADGDKGYCNIELNAAETEPASVIKWKERIFLIEDEHGWVIDDIDFGNSAAPMRHGRLSALLQAGLDSSSKETAQ